MEVNMNASKILTLSSLLGACLAAPTLVQAVPLGLYGATIDKTSLACQNWGDLVSCSAPFLNYLNNKNVGTTVANGGYVLPTPQGILDSYIVVTAGGGAQGNGDTSPLTSVVENGFKSNDVGSDNFLATGKANGTSVGAGNLSDPGNNGLTAGDNRGTWDVGAKWLLDALTINGKRRELTIGFDFNQPQNTSTSMDFWGLVTLRDLDGGKPDINYEISSSHVGYAAFATGKTFASMPTSTDFGTVQGATCIHAVNGVIVATTTIAGGQCPAGYETKVDNAQSTSDTEIINFIPELNSDLDTLVNQGGYDVLSTRLLFGCFGGTAGGAFKPGLGYLADEATGGQTVNCEGGGFSDVFLMAGAEMQQVPEPGVLVLFGLALSALGWSTKRKATR
jgi:hypothetical protein